MDDPWFPYSGLEMERIGAMNRKRKILVFSPNNAIWKWNAPMAMICHEAQAAGAELQWVRCDGLFGQFCMSKLNLGSEFHRDYLKGEEACRLCRRHAGLFRQAFGFNETHLESLVCAEEKTAIEKIVADVKSSDFNSVVYKGIPVGSLAMYEFVIQLKKSDPECTPEELPYFKGFLRNTLLSAAAARAAVEKFGPDALLVEQTGYSANRAWQLTAKSLGIPAYFFYPNSLNFAHIYELGILAQDDVFTLLSQCLERWSEIRQIPCDEPEMTCTFDHFESLFRARGHAYSAARVGNFSVHEHYNISPHQKVLIATTSSYDELLAAELAGFGFTTQSTIFPGQIEWLQAAAEWVGERSDLFLIIRIHPREHLKSVTGASSEYFRRLKAALCNLPPNVVVNWPEEKLSVYDLADEADVVLNAWSSVGLEMAFMGLPVVTFAPGAITFPMELNYWSDTREGYFRAVEQALLDGWTMERSRLAMRWYATIHKRMSLDLHDVFPYSSLEEPGFIKKAVSKALRMVRPTMEQVRVLHMAKQGMKEAHRIRYLLNDGRGKNLVDQFLESGLSADRSIEKETKLLRRGFARLFQVACSGRSTSKLHARFRKSLLD